MAFRLWNALPPETSPARSAGSLFDLGRCLAFTPTKRQLITSGHVAALVHGPARSCLLHPKSSRAGPCSLFDQAAIAGLTTLSALTVIFCSRMGSLPRMTTPHSNTLGSSSTAMTLSFGVAGALSRNWNRQSEQRQLLPAHLPKPYLSGRGDAFILPSGGTKDGAAIRIKSLCRGKPELLLD